MAPLGRTTSFIRPVRRWLLRGVRRVLFDPYADGARRVLFDPYTRTKVCAPSHTTQEGVEINEGPNTLAKDGTVERVFKPLSLVVSQRRMQWQKGGAPRKGAVNDGSQAGWLDGRARFE